jgi:hypothetical protein
MILWVTGNPAGIESRVRAYWALGFAQISSPGASQGPKMAQ